MASPIVHPPMAALLARAAKQHGVVLRRQLLDVGFTPSAIKHRISRGDLHPMWRGVYAVGRPDVDKCGRWMAATLICGPAAVLSHESAAELWQLRRVGAGPIHVSAPLSANHRREGIALHRRTALVAHDFTRRLGIPVTSPSCTLVDLADRLARDPLEAAVIEADKRGLADPDQLRRALDAIRPRPGVALLRAVLESETLALTHSELERRFLPLVRRAGLSPPLTQQTVNGFRVDFHWPHLGLIVETDGLTYHRTPAQQARDRVRDQAHTAAGLTALRFTHAQVAYQAGRVESVLRTVAQRLRKR
jgi:very-short-patch-repair endonuclease/predicted transcriptional regulator of viral defense system